MAMATAICKCATCGKEFEVRKKCCNRADADSFEKYAAEHYDECKDCHGKRMKEERAEEATDIIAKLQFPEITGKSEKQINFANDKRNEAITRLKEYPRSYRFVCDYFADDENVKTAIKKIADERYNGDVLRAIAVEYTKEASALIEIKNESDAGYILAALFDEKRNVHEI